MAELAADEVVLAEFVRQAARVGRGGSAPIDFDLHVDPYATDVVVRADKRRLERVVANLVENAQRHAGGVTRISVERAGAWAFIAVEDAGPGVAPADQERIFERFARGSAAGRRGGGDGTGLGLALVREHVRLHHGSVWVEPRPGGGARFVVKLPRAG